MAMMEGMGLLFAYILLAHLGKHVKYHVNSRDYLKSTGRYPLLLNHSTEGLFAQNISMKNYYHIEKALIGKFSGKPIDLIVNTYGGSMFASIKIAHLLRKFPNVRVVVPKYAWSGGTMISIGSGTIVADSNSIFGPVDPQVAGADGYYSAKDIQKVLKVKKPKDIDDSTIVTSDNGRKIMKEIGQYLCEIIDGRQINKKKACDMLLYGDYTHAKWIKASELKGMGFRVVRLPNVLKSANILVNNMYGLDGFFAPLTRGK